VQHLHWGFRETGLEDVLDAANGGQLSNLARFLVEDLTGEEAPEDLRNKGGLVVSLSGKDLFQVEQVLFSLY